MGIVAFLAAVTESRLKSIVVRKALKEECIHCTAYSSIRMRYRTTPRELLDRAGRHSK